VPTSINARLDFTVQRSEIEKFDQSHLRTDKAFP